MKRVLLFLSLLAFAPALQAQNLIYQVTESDIDFLPASQTGEEAVFELDGLASNAGHQSGLYDLGTADRSDRYAWRCWIQFETDPVVGEFVDIYLKTSDGTKADNDDGTGDAAVSAEDKLYNLQYIGTIVVDEVSQTAPMVTSGFVSLPHRHVGFVIWNATADQISTTESEIGCKLTPMPLEIQP